MGRYLGFVALSITLVVAACGDNLKGSSLALTDLSVSVLEDTPVTRTLPVTADEGADLAVELGTPMHGTVTVSGIEITYTPVANYHGADELSVSISDGSSTVTGKVAIAVAAVNDDPVAGADAFSTPEDTVLTTPATALLANDTDIDGDTLSVSLVGNATHGSVALVGTDVVFTPAPSFAGTATYSYTLSDGMATTLGAVAVNVGGVNDAPVAVDDVATTMEDTQVAIPGATLVANDSDPDGQTVMITGVANGTNGTVTFAANTATFTPPPNFAGIATFTYTASDGTLTDTGTVTVTVTPVNDAPIATDDLVSTNEDTAISIPIATLLGNDADVDGPSLAISMLANAMHGTAVVTGATVTFTPDPNFNGTASFDYTVTDGTLTDVGTVSINVGNDNDAPTAVDDTGTTPEDTALVITGATLVANDTDPENNMLAVTAVSNPTHGTVVLASGSVTFTPVANYVGPASFDYTVSDGGLTDVGTVNITVTPVNDAPVAVDDARTVAEDTELQIVASTLAANDTDVDLDGLTVIGVSSPVHGVVSLDGGGTIHFTGAADFTGTASFDYTVSDGTLMDVGTVVVTVTAVNDAPVAVDDSAMTNEDTPVSIVIATLTSNDTDVDGPGLGITAVSNATSGTVAIIGTDVRFTPAADFAGTAGFDYTVSDGTLTDVGHVTVTVVNTNDAPVANPDTGFSTPEETPLMIMASALTANDTDTDGPSALTITGVTAVSGGSVSLVGTTITFTPTVDFTGTATFTYAVTDGAATSSGTVSVTVTPVNDAPVAVDDSASTNEDIAIDIPIATILANDTDVDTAHASLALTVVGGAVNGTATIAGANVHFVPSANFSGAAAFDYTVSDGALTDTGTVAIAVAAVNDAPVAVDDGFSTPEDTALVLSSAMLTGNDTDQEGSTLTVTAVSNPTSGTVNLAAGSITFTPAANFSGAGGFDYTVSDGGVGTTDVGHVTVTITPVNDAPDAIDDNVAVAEDTDLDTPFATLTANDTDIEGDTRTVTGVSNPVNGTVSLQPGNIVRFRGNANFAGAASYTYIITDGNGGIDTATVNVTVTPVNDAPVAVDDSDSMSANGTLVTPHATLLANDTDVDSGFLTVTAASNPVNGTVTRNAADVTFTPTVGFSGTAGYDYTVGDGSSTDVGHVTITVILGAVCGDGAIGGAEVCDDGGTAIGDGCDASCQVEAGWTCTGAPGPGTCTGICGDSMVVGTEACDNGGTDFDGCTSVCVVAVPDCDATRFVGGDGFRIDPATGHCYVAYNATSESWAAARTRCELVGGYLPVVQSIVENQIVRNAAGPVEAVWLGLNDLAVESTFVWIDGEPFGFQNFGGGEPNNQGDEDCAHIAGTVTSWNDITCDSNAVETTACEVELDSCGDGVIQSTEGDECDDRNHTIGDGCNATCQIETGCGNGVVDAGEECDDDNTSNTDACSFPACQVLQGCGDGDIDVGEECDDGNVSNADACSSTCQVLQGCGDGDIDVGEECDDGNVSNADACSSTCQVLQGCGDGDIDVGEECDDSDIDSGDGCSATCTIEDGCGDGNIDAGEECDDDNTSNADACSSTCQVLIGCGNGTLEGTEQCDDNNVASGDGCSATCALEKLIFSEYVEGNANNKALEVKNLLATPINLTGCSVKIGVNGALPSTTLLLTQPVAAGDVVVLCGSGANAALMPKCDLLSTSGALNFNGDDSLELVCGTTLMDVIGQVGSDPGAEWGTGLTSTMDNTIRRKCSVTSGDVIAGDAFDPAAEWLGLAVDTFDGLGDPTCAP